LAGGTNLTSKLCEFKGYFGINPSAWRFGNVGLNQTRMQDKIITKIYILNPSKR